MLVALAEQSVEHGALRVQKRVSSVAQSVLRHVDRLLGDLLRSVDDFADGVLGFVRHIGHVNLPCREMPRVPRGTGVALILAVGAVVAFPGAARASHDPNDLAPVSVCKTTSPIQMLCLHQWARGHHALQPLYKQPALYSSAGQKADRILQCAPQTGFTHFPCGDGFACASGYTMCGENLAYGFTTIRAAFNALIHSPGHRNNILNAAWNAGWYGSGYRANGILPRLWVMHFSRSGGPTSTLGISLPGPLACAVMCVKPKGKVGG